MRCSSCEPLLDAYLESALRARQRIEVAQHLKECGACTAFLRELRVIDALLLTARPPGRIASDFTQAVVSAAGPAPLRSGRRFPLWMALLGYLLIAWALALMAIFYSNAVEVLVHGLVLLQRGMAALDAATRAFTPAAPLAAATVTAVLLVDLLLLAALLYGYRRLRPLIALYLLRGPRP